MAKPTIPNQDLMRILGRLQTIVEAQDPPQVPEIPVLREVYDGALDQLQELSASRQAALQSSPRPDVVSDPNAVSPELAEQVLSGMQSNIHRMVQDFVQQSLAEEVVRLKKELQPKLEKLVVESIKQKLTAKLEKEAKK